MNWKEIVGAIAAGWLVFKTWWNKIRMRSKIANSGLSLHHPTVVKTGRIFNLITKSRSGGKPTLNALHQTIIMMRDIAIQEDIKQIAMPKIGCGLDRLQWGNVREILKSEFVNTDIEIYICVWE